MEAPVKWWVTTSILLSAGIPRIDLKWTGIKDLGPLWTGRKCMLNPRACKGQHWSNDISDTLEWTHSISVPLYVTFWYGDSLNLLIAGFNLTASSRCTRMCQKCKNTRTQLLLWIVSRSRICTHTAGITWRLRHLNSSSLIFPNIQS